MKADLLRGTVSSPKKSRPSARFANLPLRVLSYNIHKGVGGRDRQYSLDRILDVIRGEQPDMVCLQEVDQNVKRSNFDDQPTAIAGAIEAVDSLYQLNVPKREGGYGNLIATRFPVVSKHHLSLRKGRRKNRGAQIVVVRTPRGRFRVVNIHLGLAEKERIWQIEHLLSHRLFLEADDLPTLVIGDTNDWRNNLEDGPFLAAGFRKLTRPPSRYRSFPAFLPMAGLDKAFVRDVPEAKARVVRTRLSREASDHLPIVVELG
ncbi:endonuclease/exonuclease/phosphatase family protein [Stratiformator vulcanicus]|uniref:endonuclease/exonuclease/phosphatase family protein n=1 Tax=Stratiformator vulcanicus TaxID=2527980 RepID=UPI002877AD2D|nr:endonuclease/exonuclease/phosphatase family protein [Stratiformator vulcanicus]